MSSPTIFQFVENDLLPFLDLEWAQEDITGYTIQLHVQQPDGTTFSIDATVEDANVGGSGTALFHFEWAAGNLVAGDSSAHVQVTDGGGLIETVARLILRVAADITVTP